MYKLTKKVKYLLTMQANANTTANVINPMADVQMNSVISDSVA